MDAPEPTSRPRTLHPAERLRRASAVASSVVVAIGAAGLAGWALDLPWLRSGGQAIHVQPNAALGLVLAGVGAIAVTRGGERARWVARALGAAAALIGLATLAEHLLGLSLGVDTLLFPDILPGVGTVAPGRMGPPSSAGLLAAGTALLLLQAGPRAAAAGQGLAIAAAPIALLGVVGYAYGVQELYGLAAISAIALPAAIAQLLLDIALLLARPDRGIAASLVADSPGGAFARRMLAYALAVPVALGAIVVTGRRAGLFAREIGIAALVVSLSAAFVLLVLRDARALDRLDSAKRRAQADRERSREELARALEREQDARRQAEQASRAKDEFLATLSHELRTPLNAVLGWSRLLLEAGGDPARLARGLAAVERNGSALAQLVSDLLDMSRVASGRMRLDLGEVDLAGVVDAALDAVQPAALAKRVRVERELEPDLAGRGDANRLRQVAWNLLSNAVKFTPEGGRVTVRLAARGDRAVLEVADDGIGLAPEFLPRVFDAFTQADASPARSHGGLGLGLAISREIVALHGGTVEAESAGHGRGATFRVLLPLLARGRRVAAAPRPAPAPPPAALAGVRVLVVDDEDDSRDLLLALLGSWGARAVGAASVGEALEAVVRDRPDLVVSDIAMPGADGFALVEALRRGEAQRGAARIPAAAITAFARAQDRERALASGFDAHVPKPIDPEVLRATLAALLASAGTRAAG